MHKSKLLLICFDFIVIEQGNVAAPQDSVSVARAKERHFTLYEQIAQDHARIGAELAAQRALFESTSEKDITQDHYQL